MPNTLLPMSTLPRSPYLFLSFSLSLFLFVAIAAHAQVPKSKQFKWVVKQGELAPYLTEFGATYHLLLVDGIFSYPFQAMFYNTTPNANIFGIRMGRRRGENRMRWVWDANRNHPVSDDATLTFGQDGNLVLAEADGRVVWQTNTANKGVAGMEMITGGNLVLHDKNGKFLWQSFDHPSDTLLVGQSLRFNGTKRLVSRVSDEDGSNGPYSLEIAREGLLMLFNYSGIALPYGGWRRSNRIESVTFALEKEVFDETFMLRLDGIFFDLVRLNYNSTFSYLRLESDGNLKIYTYYDRVVEGAWMETFAYFTGDYVSYPFYYFGYDRRCGLPKKCGEFGLCQEGMCVACPQPRVMLGWSDRCAPPKIPSPCKAGARANYYKIDGAEHFLSRNTDGEGPLKVEECREKCSKDCKCAGFFHWKETSKCWLVPFLGTIRKVEESSHVAYIKY